MPLLCYITDRRQFPGNGREQQLRLLEKIAECAAAGVNYIQLREKDLSIRELQELAQRAVAALPSASQTKLLINSRIDVALACGAHGVHLPADDIRASEARALFVQTGKATPVIGVSCHTVQEVAMAEAHGADFAVFAPVFEKDGQRNSSGLDLLRQACKRPDMAATPILVLALGGVTLENAAQCVSAGASGIAAVRLFQQNDVAPIVEALRGIPPSGTASFRTFPSPYR
jgi:thiamine-phosphate pyrophosphorylase